MSANNSMVELKSNLLTTAIIVGFTVLIGFFAFNFAGVTQDTAKTTIQEVNRTSDKVVTIISNLTGAINDLTALKEQELQTFRSGFFNLSTLMYQQVNLIQEERNETGKNLALFLSTFANQSTDMQNAINELNKDGNASREKQTEVFVETLELSQNVSLQGQEIGKERNNLERNQSVQFNEIIKLLGGNGTDEHGSINVTIPLTPNGTVVER